VTDPLCQRCKRIKARNFIDAAAGRCPLEWARGDLDAELDCAWHVDPNAAAAAVHVQAVRETAKASEAQPWRAPRIAPHERRAADRERAPDAIDAYWATWSTEDPE
jgi:hypothetical protein